MITKREKTMQVVLNMAFIVLCAVVIIPFIMVVVYLFHLKKILWNTDIPLFLKSLTGRDTGLCLKIQRLYLMHTG